MTKLKSDSYNDSEKNIIAHKCVRIYKNYANLWVKNDVLTTKNVFTTISSLSNYRGQAEISK